jgi:hypothetical protein
MFTDKFIRMCIVNVHGGGRREGGVGGPAAKVSETFIILEYYSPSSR